MYVVETTPRSVFTHCVSAVSFGFYSEEEIRALAVKQITSEATFDAMGLPLPGGVYDPALGPFSRECGEYVLLS
jgi:DNA-directed RNA polymerase I subunit RPA1